MSFCTCNAIATGGSYTRLKAIPVLRAISSFSKTGDPRDFSLIWQKSADSYSTVVL